MSRFLLKYNLNNIYFKSCLQLSKNHSISNDKTKNCKILFRNQLKPTNFCVLRCAPSKSITIKKYESSRKFARIWKLERLMNWSLIMMIPGAFALESKEMEMTLSAAAIMHTYWGCQSICSDYLRSSNVGKILPIIVRVSIVFLTLASFAGFYKLIYEDIGLINMIKKFWSIRGQDYVPPNRFDLVKKRNNLHNTFSRK